MSKALQLMTSISTPILTFRNRVVMAPMNRRRALHGIPGRAAVTYYGQRAGAGLIITDNTAIMPNGIGYLLTPAIYNEAQKVAWKTVAEEVHRHGGKIFMQLVHAGRIGHIDNNEDGSPIIAPSAITAQTDIRVAQKGHLPASKPKALTTMEVQELVQAFIHAAQNAVAAGMDGIEIHGAHGYLIEQFLHPQTNQRTDEYGGSIINRSRFLLEIVEGVAAVIGKERTGIRLSPFYKINDLLPYPEEVETHRHLIGELNKLGILYIHLSNPIVHDVPIIPEWYLLETRSRFNNLIILAGGFTAESAEVALKKDLADMIAFGRPYIANPDLVNRFEHGLCLAEGRVELFYDGGDEGYIDYPPFFGSGT